jgi:hypothetical protein
MIIFNMFGALFMAISGLAGLLVGGFISLFTRDDSLPMGLGGFTGMAVVAACDLWYRSTHNRFRKFRYLNPFTGGMFFLVPVWIFFCAGPLVALVVMAVGKRLGLN